MTSRRWWAVVFAVVSLQLAGCATTPPDASSRPESSQRVDPWENWNRKVYAFNDAVDEAVLVPVSTAYTKVVPEPVRRGIGNFFGNVSDVWSAFNNFLQGKFANGLQDVIRVGTNTLFGLGGFLDVASEFGADRQGEDFGQTLGWWGMAPGPYVVWPLLGPSTLRDSFAVPLDRAVSPALAVSSEGGRYALVGLQVVNERANLLGAGNLLNDIAFDKYIFMRDAYLQRRRSLVYDGNPPDEADESADEDDAAPAPAEAPTGDGGAR